MSLAQRIEEVRHRIVQACRRCGRSPASVTLVAVTKTVPVDLISSAMTLGITEFGENRVQEAQAKRQALSFRTQAAGCTDAIQSTMQPESCGLQPVRWHLIGHLQRNKVKPAVQLFDVIHSVDSMALIEELARHVTAAGHRFQASGRSADRWLEAFVQVNVSGEKTKFGCGFRDAAPLAGAILKSSGMRLAGLMTIVPFSEEPEGARPYFRRLRALRDDVAAACSLQPAALKLSMGMSHDFEVAIEEGADIVRIGTAIFGARHE